MPVCGGARSAVAERATAAGMAERHYARSCEQDETGWPDRRRRPWLRGPDAARKARSASARIGPTPGSACAAVGAPRRDGHPSVGTDAHRR